MDAGSRWQHVCDDELECLGLRTILERAGVRTRQLSVGPLWVLEALSHDDGLRAARLEGQIARHIASQQARSLEARQDRRARWSRRVLLGMAACVALALAWRWISI